MKSQTLVTHPLASISLNAFIYYHQKLCWGFHVVENYRPLVNFAKIDNILLAEFCALTFPPFSFEEKLPLLVTLQVSCGYYKRFCVMARNLNSNNFMCQVMVASVHSCICDYIMMNSNFSCECDYNLWVSQV
jgi:hypothetical protein